MADFQERLALPAGAPAGTFAAGRRQLGVEQYWGLMLFGLLNPVVESMRGLCAASRLQRVQAEICDRAVSLGSFSEAQAVIAPELLQKVFAELAAETQPYPGDPPQIEEAGCSFVLRLRPEAVFAVVEEFALRAEDRAAGVSFDGLVRLGCKKKYQVEPLRLVRVPTETGELLLVTDQSPPELSAELLALIYRYRWRSELFFKWLKCILGCRHWLAQSPRGVAVQVYCALMAAVLLLRSTGRRPGKRAMEDDPLLSGRLRHAR